MTIDQSYNFRRIDDRVTTSGIVSRQSLQQLSAQGYQAVINLLPDDSKYAEAGEADLVKTQGLQYVYVPVDFAAPTHEDFAAFAAAMDDLEGRRVHLHCAANFRVSAFYGLWAEQRGRMTAAEADDLMRGVWNPDEHPAWSRFLAEERARFARRD